VGKERSAKKKEGSIIVKVKIKDKRAEMAGQGRTEGIWRKSDSYITGKKKNGHERMGVVSQKEQRVVVPGEVGPNADESFVEWRGKLPDNEKRGRGTRRRARRKNYWYKKQISPTDATRNGMRKGPKKNQPKRRHPDFVEGRITNRRTYECSPLPGEKTSSHYPSSDGRSFGPDQESAQELIEAAVT